WSRFIRRQAWTMDHRWCTARRRWLIACAAFALQSSRLPRGIARAAGRQHPIVGASMTVKTVRTCASLVVSLCIAACAPLDGDDATVGEISEQLRTSDWSAAAYVGSDFQEGCLGGQVAALNGTMYMVHSGTCGDEDYTDNLWWTRLTPSGWTNDIQIPNQ